MARVWYSSPRFSRDDSRSSASSISLSDDRFIPWASPRSDVPTVLRNSTSGSRKLSRKPKKQIGTATRKTVWIAWVTAAV